MMTTTTTAWSKAGEDQSGSAVHAERRETAAAQDELRSLPPLATAFTEEMHALRPPHCQWKGWRKSSWATGEGDLDLLIERSAASSFTAMMEKLGFKRALARNGRHIAGVESWLGHDPSCAQLLHVHVHYHLVIGPSWGRRFRLPIEQTVIDTALAGTPFPIPSLAYQLLLFVLRSTLQQPVYESGTLRRLREKLAMLEGVVRRSEVADAVLSVPGLDLRQFDRCVASFQPAFPLRSRLAIRYELERRLAAHASGSSTTLALARAAGRRVLQKVWPRALRTIEGSKQLATGGAVIALVGSDGAGKSTCARTLQGWLGRELGTGHAHLGRPPRSVLTLLLGGVLKLGRSLGAAPGWRLLSTLELMRHAGTARDRVRLARRAGRVAARGGIMICERYPIPQNRALVGPSSAQGAALAARGRFADWLRRYEGACYARISPPDLVVLLRIDPEDAVARKPEEPAGYVRRRARVLSEADWSDSSVRIVDAGRPLADVTAELRARIWEAL